MKKIFNSSKIILGAGLLFFTLNSCKNEPKPLIPKETAEYQNGAKFENDTIEDDATLLVDVAEMSILEIEIGKLAQTKGISQDVKKYAKMLVEGHAKSFEELKALANKKTITLPISITDTAREKYNKLNEKSGTDFDKMFVEMMVEEHEEAVDKMNKIAQKASDTDIKLWASRQVNGLTNHFEQAKKLDKKSGG